jgi:hypothetical protein
VATAEGGGNRGRQGAGAHLAEQLVGKRRRERGDARDGALARRGTRGAELLEERREAGVRLLLPQVATEALEQVVEDVHALELHLQRVLGHA